MKTLIDKAEVLLEALPYIQKFRNAVMVIKFGGSAMENPDLVRKTMRDIVLLECIGIRPVVVHGGGKAISAALKKREIPVNFIFGLRHTCGETIQVVDDVLHNQINRELVELARNAGGQAIGISGKSVLSAEKMFATNPENGERVDVGFVGDIVAVDGSRILEALNAGQIPVITPLGTGIDGQIYNINADIAACKVAEAIHARKLVFLSDVPGIMRDPGDESTVIPTICTTEINALIQDKVISGGMLPKIQSCLRALQAGTNKVHLIDGRVVHSLLLEIFTDSGIGTEIVKPDSI
ncbi:acetylglutamate kinase [Victivallis sp. Marseille-Q1083]|uniref:acetylglutamate kinase n=1 Tax=Victivallis sp. Marseille-Q1083 TaxID=2717288 RepID=UPI00158D3E6B|nr:acetylglutamate kinase [Victivallis sp. Marseille-Q1083]